MTIQDIVIKGAKQNNLKNIDITIPRDEMIVITGLSGSGKSSLAFDTIYAEGQRRYVESLSSYARQFLGQMDKPDVEYIEGLSPSISIDQKTTSQNPRSTVGTVTEIYDYLRLFFARIGTPYCPICGEKITSQTIDEIIDKIMAYEERTRLMILAPVVQGKKGQHKRLLENLKKEGFIRVIIDGEMRELHEDIELNKNQYHDIDLVVDRIIVREGTESRLADSLETALNLSEGIVKVEIIEGETITFSTKLACPNGHISYDEIEPRSFSFNNPYGMCPDCDGLGFHREFDKDLIIPNLNLSFEEGAIDPYASAQEDSYYYEALKQVFEKHKFPLDKALKDAPKKLMDDLLNGTEYIIEFQFDSRFAGNKKFKGRWEGIIPNLRKRYLRTSSDAIIERMENYMTDITCSTCHGDRLKKEFLSILINGKNITETTKMSIHDSLNWFKNLELKDADRIIGQEILKEIISRLSFLEQVGLGYLTLARSSGTLSGGESQRIRLATQIGSALVGVTYVLDEPSIGLHQRDNSKLLEALRNLTDIGNTVIIVEHDEETMKNADYIVDIGPGAGVHGGYLMAKGTLKDIIKEEKSITGQYLSGKKKIEIPEKRKKWSEEIIIKGARENNLKNIDVAFPLGTFTAVTGVSGSGKSSLVNEILYKSLSKEIYRSKAKPGNHDEVLNIEKIDKVIQIDQSPIGRTPRSNPATYTKVFDPIRDLFASTPQAKMRGYKKGRFSFNVKGGRCEACRGDGTKKVEMHFLPDVYVPCEVCKGKRYNRETLQITYKEKSIADVLDMTVEEAYDFFENHIAIERRLRTLKEVGLGYLKLGQPSTELSGGEAQRVKLASELSKRNTGKTFYILDEPTTGLHAADIKNLLHVLQQLVDLGNTVLVIEHNLDVIKTADHIIDLGPGGGEEGGKIVATGTPEEISKIKESYTGQYLKNIL